MKLHIYLFCSLFISIANGQVDKPYSKEFSFITENDLYVLKHTDSYYTNGFIFQFNKVKNIKNIKNIFRYELGQTMFTTKDRREVWRGNEPIDRPYCGYLYGKFSKDKFLDKSKIFSYKIELGVTGDWALARPLQEWYHKKIGLFDYPYWETQIPNSVGLSAGIKYAATINPEKANQSSYKIVPVVEANAGNYFINAKVGAYFCAGKFEKTENSVLLNSRINVSEIKNKRNYELIFYYYPQLIFQGYNATIQGDLFAKELPTIVFVSKPSTLVMQNTFGVAYAKKRWTTRLEVIYQTKEAVSQIKSHEYAGIQAAYRF
jgi:hypothetical protein